MAITCSLTASVYMHVNDAHCACVCKLLLQFFSAWYTCVLVFISLCCVFQATLQFCVVKPVVAALTIILEAFDVYKEGHLR